MDSCELFPYAGRRSRHPARASGTTGAALPPRSAWTPAISPRVTGAIHSVPMGHVDREKRMITDVGRLLDAEVASRTQITATQNGRVSARRTKPHHAQWASVRIDSLALDVQ
jgi:hypothetical protein